jgi:hypothetical protein
MQVDWLHPYMEPGEKSCVFQHSFLPLAFVLHSDEKAREIIPKQHRYLLDDPSWTFSKWIVGPGEGEDVCNLVRMVIDLDKARVLRFKD